MIDVESGMVVTVAMAAMVMSVHVHVHEIASEGGIGSGIGIGPLPGIGRLPLTMAFIAGAQVLHEWTFGGGRCPLGLVC